MFIIRVAGHYFCLRLIAETLQPAVMGPQELRVNNVLLLLEPPPPQPPGMTALLQIELVDPVLDMSPIVSPLPHFQVVEAHVNLAHPQSEGFPKDLRRPGRQLIGQRGVT